MVSISNHFEPYSDPDNVNEQEDCAERILNIDSASMDFTGHFRVCFFPFFFVDI